MLKKIIISFILILNLNIVNSEKKTSIFKKFINFIKTIEPCKRRKNKSILNEILDKKEIQEQLDNLTFFIEIKNLNYLTPLLYPKMIDLSLSLKKKFEKILKKYFEFDKNIKIKNFCSLLSREDKDKNILKTTETTFKYQILISIENEADLYFNQKKKKENFLKDIENLT